MHLFRTLGCTEIGMEQPVFVFFQKFPALGNPLWMGIHFLYIGQRRPRQSQKIMFNTHVFFTGNMAIIAVNEIVHIGNATSRGIFNRQDTITYLPPGYSLNDVFKLRSIPGFYILPVKIGHHRLIRVGPGQAKTGNDHRHRLSHEVHPSFCCRGKYPVSSRLQQLLQLVRHAEQCRGHDGLL